MRKQADATRSHAPAAGTGAWRRQQPSWVAHLPPCNAACPAGENIQAWLALAQPGKYRQAWETLMRGNQLPDVNGRVCYNPCETSCNRVEPDAAVRIHARERLLGNIAASRDGPAHMRAHKHGKRVA